MLVLRQRIFERGRQLRTIFDVDELAKHRETAASHMLLAARCSAYSLSSSSSSSATSVAAAAAAAAGRPLPPVALLLKLFPDALLLELLPATLLHAPPGIALRRAIVTK